jgi:hypothetical protein
MITQVRGYQTSDGQIHTDRATALTQELKIELRGLVQQHTRSQHLTTTDVAAFLAGNMDKVGEVMTSYRKKIAAISRKAGEKTLTQTAA